MSSSCLARGAEGRARSLAVAAAAFCLGAVVAFGLVRGFGLGCVTAGSRRACSSSAIRSSVEAVRNLGFFSSA